ncbi:NLP/P60 protein [Candidatus Accumulibacter aalborgensis]|uniref:NLP/P60 protein n=2 Tax=Candidatus Accumulibacter aalborgensis TaxID=1860102 RepID=A0A1A8XGH6_9PROT|nr:NLP/P60 protein [Candidatus Accumulibacter aalborgensis]
MHDNLAKSEKEEFILCAMRAPLLIAYLVSLLLAGCGSTPPPQPDRPLPATRIDRPASNPKAHEVVIFALGLIDTGYRFGGKNPEAGLDCSGLVSYIYGRAAGIKVSGSAADIASRGHPIERASLRPGDLVFFNTRNASFSHVGIYIGDERFVHAPSSNGRVRIDQLGARYYAQRFETARSYFD